MCRFFQRQVALGRNPLDALASTSKLSGVVLEVVAVLVLVVREVQAVEAVVHLHGLVSLRMLCLPR